MLVHHVHRGSTLAHWGITLPRRKIVGRVLKQPHGVLDTVPQLVDPLRLIAVVSHRPAQGLYPVLHDLRCPLYAVELGTVAEHGNDVGRVFLLVANELEGNAPEHGHADEVEARR